MNTQVNNHLSESQQRFFILLEQYPKYLPYWNSEKCSCDLVGLENAYGVFSHGECVMAKFFVGLWRGQNQHLFDLFEAAGLVDEKAVSIILTWFENPFWP